VCEALVDVAQDPRRAPDRLQLGGLLDGSQAEDDARRGQELEAALAQVLLDHKRHVLGLDGDGSFGEAAQARGERPRQIAVELHDLRSRHRAGGLDVAPVGEQHHVLVIHQHKGVRARETREVLDVDRVRDEEGGRSEPVQLGAQPLDAFVHEFLARYSSASR
jgi:hypothetical protein